MEFCQCALDNRPAVFFAAVGFQFEQFFRNFIETVGQRHDYDIVVARREVAVAVFIERDLDLGFSATFAVSGSGRCRADQQGSAG